MVRTGDGTLAVPTGHEGYVSQRSRLGGSLLAGDNAGSLEGPFSCAEDNQGTVNAGYHRLSVDNKRCLVK